MRSKAGGDRLSFVEFQLPTLVDEPPEGHSSIHEIKYDGYRTELVIERGEARAFTRNGHDKYGPIVGPAREVGGHRRRSNRHERLMARVIRASQN